MSADLFDIIIAITVCLYTLSGFISGFIVQFARFFAIIAAFWAMRSFSADLVPYLNFVAEPSWRNIVAAIIVFIGVLLAIGILARILKKIVNYSFGGWLDKLLGAILSFAISVIIWSAIIIILEKIFPDSEFLRNSRLVPYFIMFINYISQWLPPELAKYFTIK